MSSSLPKQSQTIFKVTGCTQNHILPYSIVGEKQYVTKEAIQKNS